MGISRLVAGSAVGVGRGGKSVERSRRGEELQAAEAAEAAEAADGVAVRDCAVKNLKLVGVGEAETVVSWGRRTVEALGVLVSIGSAAAEKNAYVHTSAERGVPLVEWEAADELGCRKRGLVEGNVSIVEACDKLEDVVEVALAQGRSFVRKASF